MNKCTFIGTTCCERKAIQFLSTSRGTIARCLIARCLIHKLNFLTQGLWDQLTEEEYVILGVLGE